MNKTKIRILNTGRENYRHRFSRSYLQYWLINSNKEEWVNMKALIKKYNLHKCFKYYE